MFYEQTFFSYVQSGELPRFTFTQTTASSASSTFTITDPTGAVQKTCNIPPLSPINTTTCTSAGLTSTSSGIWSIRYTPNTPTPGARWVWTIDVVNGANTVIPGRVWVEAFNQYQTNAANETFWMASREGYVYRMDFRGYSGQGSFLRANGFGLVEAGTCIPIYKSVQGSISGANGSVVDPRYEFSDACGDNYKMFLEQPAADLPAAAPIAGGTQWIRPAVVPPSATNLTLQQQGPFSRAGQIQFDLAGVNGGYTVQLDTNANGVYTDPVDRTIPWGSPPGAVSVPFDGLDGLGNPLSVCTAMRAKVVVDRVGETHVVLDDVESLGTSSVNNYGIRVTGATPGVVGPNPKLYWDDRDLVGGGAPLPYADGRAGVDTTTTITGAHGWGQWGDMRSIENWTYYVAQAGAEVTLPDACDASLVLAKDGELDDANENGAADVGETIDYTFTVTNSGNAPVSDVTVQDDRVTGITPATATIPVFGERIFTAAPYTVTQADVDAGGVPNTASAAGVDPLGAPVISNEASDFVPTTARAPELVLDKVATLADSNSNGLADAGETIAYTFEVQNTGNVTIEDVAISDERVTGLAPATVNLPPGGTQTFTAAAYTVTQADLNIGSIDNTAFAAGTSPIGPVQSNSDSTTTPTPTPNPQLVLDKSATISGDVDGDGRADVGDTIAYTFAVENAGNLDITQVTINDPRITAITPAAQDIPAGQTRNFTATYVATQADVDAGSIPNTADADGIYAGVDGPTPIVSAPDVAVIPTPDQVSGLELSKDGTLADANGNALADAGESIAYTFTVTNTGNVTMENVTVFDDRVATITPATATIAPGGSQVFTATGYAVTQDDVDAGAVVNTAYARGNIPGGAETFSDPDEDVQDVPAPVPALTLDKTATLLDRNGNGTADEGEQIAYGFLVTNTGNVTLTSVGIDDDKVAALLPDAIDFLPPTASYLFNSDPYTVTAEDVAAGEIINVASASGTAPSNVVVESDEDSATIRATPPVVVEPPVVTPLPVPGGDGQLPATGGAVPGLVLGSALALLLLGAVLARRRATR